MLALCIDDKWNLLGWADSNNMKNGLREELLKSLTSQDHHMVEIVPQIHMVLQGKEPGMDTSHLESLARKMRS